jgi:hypothetical protein
MKYAKITIDQPGVNLGNRLIEYALASLLHLPKPHVSISMFSIPSNFEIEKINACDFVLLPGSTILADAPGNSDALKIINKIKIPKICASGSCWGPRYKPFFNAIKQITQPIGCRDTYTYSICKKLGVKAILVGCPTAYLPKQDLKSEKPYTIVGFARDHINWQVQLLKQIKGKKVCSLQEYKFELPIAKKLKADVFTYSNPKEVMRRYAETSKVITGRLHSVLPAISQDKAIMFFGHKQDTRFSLLEYIGVKIWPMKGNQKIILQTNDAYNAKVNDLKNSFFQWAKEVKVT